MVSVQINTQLLPTYQLVRSMNFGWEDQYVFDVTANSQYAIASASDNMIRLYDLSTLQPAASLNLHQQRISKIKLFNDQYLFSASEDGKLARWDLRASTTTPVQIFHYPRPLSAFDVNCNDTMAVVGTLNEDVVQAAELGFFDTRQTQLIHKFEESHGDDVTEIQCHPTIPSQLISSSTDGLINSYDVSEFDEEEALLAVVNSGSSVNKAGYFGPNAEYLYCLTHLETFSIHTIEGDLMCDYGQLKQLDGVDYAIDCNYDPISQRLYLETGNNNGSSLIFHVNIDELQLCQTLHAPGGHTDVVRSIYWNHTTQSILTGGEDGIMCAWQG
ncbi:WD40-repeat-containing domain protein [Halteromyces radiatus]|uniref:WD40-repeat-containing domain protein n=1 Tax=Halteromyces radiatus TaxID=101107 RepID=UPI00221F1B5E|nr:WD40-repeat-containing domain protein [Halteromyces radiatus]KAI8093394.1 WD40-repeat-containing domain protein [Halteromyces radiatus]